MVWVLDIVGLVVTAWVTHHFTARHERNKHQLARETFEYERQARRSPLHEHVEFLHEVAELASKLNSPCASFESLFEAAEKVKADVNANVTGSVVIRLMDDLAQAYLETCTALEVSLQSQEASGEEPSPYALARLDLSRLLLMRTVKYLQPAVPLGFPRDPVGAMQEYVTFLGGQAQKGYLGALAIVHCEAVAWSKEEMAEYVQECLAELVEDDEESSRTP
jgi:hypothetical protein